MPSPERIDDQASGLRDMANPRPVQVIAVTSGKGGVGKTTVAVNLALSLIRRNRNVMIFDADLGLANVDVLLGLQPSRNLSHVLAGECELSDIVLDGPLGLQVVPAASGNKTMTELGAAEHVGMIRAFSALSPDLDVLIVDTAAGIAESVGWFSQAANEVLVVVCDEPASLTDAYALIKVLSKDYRVTRFNVLANQTRDTAEGRELFEKLERVTDRFLDVHLLFAGAIPYDRDVRKSAQQQCAVVDVFPHSASALAFGQLGRKTAQWSLPTAPSGNVEFFVERLARLTPASEGAV
ncbi:MAG: MinD/ParA family protein [Pseudomonadota bacterium]